MFRVCSRRTRWICAALVSFLAACDAPISHETRTTAAREAVATTTTPAAAGPAALAPIPELGQVCASAGGSFSSGECICPTDQPMAGVPVLQNFDARSGGSCVRPARSIVACASGGLEKLLDDGGLSAFRACVEAPFYFFRRSTVLFRLPPTWTSRDDARALARWLDQRLQSPATFFAKLSPPPGSNDSLVIALGATSLQDVDVEMSFDLPAIDPGQSEPPSGFANLVHVPSVSELDWALGNTVRGPRPARSVAPAWAGPLGAQLERAIAGAPFDLSSPIAVHTILQRCLGLCDLRQDYQLTTEDGQPLQAWRIRRYQSGVLYRETLAIGDRTHQRVDGWVVFDLGGQPSLIFQVERAASRLKPRVSAFDRNWQRLGEFQFDLLPDLLQATAVVNAAAPLRDGEAGVILFDSGLTFTDADVNSALLVGPHRADDSSGSGSELGWLDAPGDDAIAFLDGVRETVQGIYSTSGYPRSHGAGVARLLVGGDHAPIRILPTSLPEYARDPSVLPSVASDPRLSAQVRVINLSAVEYADLEACKARFPGGLDPSFLWVTGAGNSGRASTLEAPLARCPQELESRGNLIVVAGAEGLSLWPLSDYGSAYADLAADCSTDTGRCDGTSYAAPRVARTAALIGEAFGDRISNPMIRVAILLGATLPSTPAPVRSGAFHDHEGAMRAAEQLVSLGYGRNAALPANQARQILGELWDSDYAHRKFDLLFRNGTFSE